MPKRTFFTSITPLPSCVTREIVMDMLHSYTDIIDLNPLVEERHSIPPPPNATTEEYHCDWYSLTDRVQYLPGGIITGKVSYTACFHHLANGLQAHYYAPLGMNIKNKWTLCGSLPGEAKAPVEIGVGAPRSGLYLREDVKLSCNFIAVPYVKKAAKKAHALLVSRLVARAQFLNVRPPSICLNQNYTKFQNDYEPIEFGRDGQVTQDIIDEPSIRNPRFSTFSYMEPERPITAYDSERKFSLKYNPSTFSLPKNDKYGRSRALSTCSPVATSKLWQSLNNSSSSAEISPITAKIEPPHEETCFELDAQEYVPVNDEANSCWEMSTDTEIKKNLLLEKVQRTNSLSKPIVIERIELEG
ncbi:hypothetical protein EPUL_002417 [Erysiphe pulchra]|uniref:DUF7053 domain-containing protein n=1 Tax=Erysiphe pulchra TaxID=225359 RepID=A0A2S4Q045_9PEZI|nr:hypothetical protein EPUL_002417 [Erysiphe pulchra]